LAFNWIIDGVVGTLGSQLAYNALTNNISGSEWVISQTAFGEYENQLRIYLNISDQTGLFEYIPLNTWIVVFTIELI